MNNSEILKRLTSFPGIQEPNSMQRDVMESKERECVIIAPTGSGKTLAFGIIILKTISLRSCRPQALIIAPSRELVIQTGEVMRQFAKGYKTVELYGGHSFSDETASMQPMADIIVATPGRLLDHLQRGSIVMGKAPEVLVLDEYDKSLQLGFENEMKRIIQRIGHPRNFVLTSATELNPLPQYLGMVNPEIIYAKSDTSEAGTVETIRVESFSRDKLDSLSALLRTLPHDGRCIVFVNHRESAERVYKRLKDEGFSAGLYHGALDQQQRMTAIDLLTNGTTPILVATDLAARGLDIKDIESVIHYHLPVDRQAWIHRNGRTGRQNADGCIYVITSEADSIADFMNFDRFFQPPAELPDVTASKTGTLYFSAGKKEKISKGDIAGFILSNSDLTPQELGKIAVHDHYALAAVPADRLRHLASDLSALKIKGKRVRITQLKV